MVLDEAFGIVQQVSGHLAPCADIQTFHQVLSFPFFQSVDDQPGKSWLLFQVNVQLDLTVLDLSGSDFYIGEQSLVPELIHSPGNIITWYFYAVPDFKP